jgi:hypothetical protein
MPRTAQEIIDHAEELADLFESDASLDWEERPIAESLLRRAVLHRAQGEAEVRDAVVKARSDGMTWKLIGTFLGTTAQAAHQRYGAVVNGASSA